MTSEGKQVSWIVWTGRASEAPRTGYGEDDLQKTLRHLRGRGDSTVKVSRDGGDIVEVDLWNSVA